MKATGARIVARTPILPMCFSTSYLLSKCGMPVCRLAEPTEVKTRCTPAALADGHSAQAVHRTSRAESPARRWPTVLVRRFSGAPGPLHKARLTGVSLVSRASGYTPAGYSALDIPVGAPIESWLQSSPRSSPLPPARSVRLPQGPSRSGSDIDSPKLVPW